MGKKWCFMILVAKCRLQNSPQTPLFAMSEAHLKRGAFSTGEKTTGESPFFQVNL
jgi:hypothetical protein